MSTRPNARKRISAASRQDSQPATAPGYPRLAVLLAAACSLFLIAIGTWATYWADLRNDQFQLIHLGQTIYDGGRLYVDCWENKPPGIAWINALGLLLSGGRMIGPWLLPGVTAVACLALMTYAVGRLLSLSAACWTLILASAVYTLRLYDTPSINPDFYSSMFELAACAMWLVSIDATTRKGRVFLALVAGLAWAASTGVKQTGIVGLLMLSVVAVLFAVFRRDEAKGWGRSCALAWLGFALGIGAVIGALAYRGTLGLAWEAAFEFNRQLASMEALRGAALSWPRAWAGLSPLTLALWLGLVGVAIGVWTGNAKKLVRPFAVALIAWWLIQVALALLGPSRSMRYWQSTFPAMLWAAGIGIYLLEDNLRRAEKGHRGAVTIAYMTVVAFLAAPMFMHLRVGFARSDLTYASGHPQRTRLAELGKQIEELVPENRPIYVWSYDTGVYLSAKRRAASTFTYPRSREQMNAILADLKTGQAQAILIPQRPAAEFDHWCDEACQETREQILAAYDMRSSTDHYTIWVRPAPP